MTYAKKHLGQHFLVDRGVLQALVEHIALMPGDHVVEIGPGRGALTQPLAPLCERYWALEFDRDMVDVLATRAWPEGFELIQGDALTFDFAPCRTTKPLRLVGNLPYNISTPLLFRLLSHAWLWQDMHLMLQWEVVQRLVAMVGSTHYGRLSVMVQAQCEVEGLLAVPPDAFKPPPAVDSGVVRLVPRVQEGLDVVALGSLVRRAFGHRRKTLANNLGCSSSLLESLGLPPRVRPQEVSVVQYQRLLEAGVL